MPRFYGPTAGDGVRPADTELCDRGRAVPPDDEAVVGGGKTIRESMVQGLTTRADGAPDVIITNALILGHKVIVKADYPPPCSATRGWCPA